MFGTFKLTQQQQALCDYKTVIVKRSTGISNSNQKIMLIAK